MYSENEMNNMKNEIATLEKVPKIDFNAHLLPKNREDTFCDTIATTSPDGKMSKRTKERLDKKLGKSLFGDWTPDVRHEPAVAHKLRDYHYILRLMGLVNRGVGPRKYKKEIDRVLSLYEVSL